jgi:hypothetical protein
MDAAKRQAEEWEQAVTVSRMCSVLRSSRSSFHTTTGVGLQARAVCSN